MEALNKAIQERTASLAVLGLGYVGLPVACMFAHAGFQVVGIRRNAEKVGQINRGICPIEGDEPGLPELLVEVVASGRFEATTEIAACREADVVLIAVETPVNEATKKPQYLALRAALQGLGRNLKRGALVIIESTIAPGTMDRVVKPVLEEQSSWRANLDFHLAHCPERVMPGKLLANIRSCHRVVGGMSPEAATLAVALYRYVVQADLDPVDCLTAELVKTMENAYRDVQIAFANEMALLCDDMGADVWAVRDLVNKSPYRAMHLPGAGVGGHCIPKDPWLLIANTGDRFRPRLIPMAREVNDGMPLYMVELTIEALRRTGRDIAGAKILVMGYAYLENSDDTRNSPSETLVTRLLELGAQVKIHDPWVPEYQGDLEKRAQGCDAALLMVAHDAYRAVDLGRLGRCMAQPILIDGRHLFSAAQARAASWDYHGVGQGY